MDPVTHLSSGVMGALAFQRFFPKTKFFLPFCLLASWIADGDILFGDGDPEFSLLHHRGITTSFIGGLFLALGVALLLKLVSRKTPFIKSAALAYGLVLTHIWLDLITTYGTQILAPFSNHRFALDGAFIIDPLFTLTALSLIGAAVYMKSKRTVIAMVGMAWFFVYPLTNMGLSSFLEQSYADRLDAKGISHTHVHVTPDALSPRFWKVVTTSNGDYLLDTIDLFSDEKPIPMRRYKRADNGELEQLGKQASIFGTYKWFSKWPYIEEETHTEGKTLIFGDLRFTSTNPVLAKVFENRKQPFMLTAYVDSEGNLLRWTFVKGASSIGETTER